MEANLHFLVVDDDAESRTTIVEFLRVMGFTQVTLAHNGTEAIRLLDRDSSINFIISDWDMPLMNGFSLLQRIKLNPDRSQIPFLVVTSPISAETEKISMAAENKVDGYLIKPFRGALLKEKIQKILTVSAIGSKRQVVVVDDDPDSREMIVEYLKAIGFKEVPSFPDGEVALKYVNEFSKEIGLIISDWEMPKISGIDFLRACKSNKDLESIPFLMVTSQSSIERMKIIQAARANVDEYLLKPFNMENFQSRIQSVVGQSKSAIEVRELVIAGNQELENGRFQQAYSKFEAVLKLHENHEGALRGIADAIAKIRGIQAAIPYYKKAIEANPVFPKTYLKLSQTYERMGWIDRAVALLQNAILNIGFNADLHFALGKLFCKQNKMDEAIQELNKTLEIQLDHQEAKIMLQMLQIQKKGDPK